MKKIILLFFIFLSIFVSAQQSFLVHSIKLPSLLGEAENQFSGIFITGKKLYLMPECRIQDKHEARIYAIKLADIEQSKNDTSYILPYEKIILHGLDSLAVLIKKDGQEFEGLEALLIRGQHIYFSVETTTPSAFCYLLKGKMKKGHIYMDYTYTALRKPVKKDGSGIHNAGFEAITFSKKRVAAFYEYNYFDKNFVYRFNKKLRPSSLDSANVQRLPFRITDITATGRNHFTALNYFYKGNGGDTVYRVGAKDSSVYSLIHPQSVYTDYNSIIDISYSNKQFNWKTLWVFPKNLTGYNWEGIAAYKKGYFIINDKFTQARPYHSELLYLKPGE